MAIAIFEHDNNQLAEIVAILQEGGHFDAFSTNNLAKLRDAMNIDGGTNVVMRVQVNLLILDLDDGPEALDLLRQLKTDVRYKDVPVIVTSEYDFDQQVRTAYVYGASDFIRKPLNKSEAKARIHASLRLNHEIDRRKARENEITEIANQLRDLTQVLMKLSLIDQLTGVANRRAFDQTLEQEFKRSRRNRQPLSILLFDVDHFKFFNDTYGHQAGDLCLRRVAQEVLNTIKRPGDMLARFGGEEFSIILPDTDVSGAKVIAQRVLAGIAALNIRHEHNSAAPCVTVSVGAATYLGSDPNSETKGLVGLADQLLYAAKKAGRNRVQSGALDEQVVIPPKAS
ncbi:MAG: diguanylate cyclase [Proteobacteria bacterium]|nr:diguanylate cyclase [Pseudomonadota bacterium]